MFDKVLNTTLLNFAEENDFNFGMKKGIIIYLGWAAKVYLGICQTTQSSFFAIGVSL